MSGATTIAEQVTTATRDWVLGKEGKHVPATQLNGTKVFGLYFSAHWCGPCRGFTPELIKVYNELRAQGQQFEVVFVSSDQDQAAFDEYYLDMPWLAVPFTDEDCKKTLSEKYQVEGIPTLVLLNGDGSLLMEDARGAVTQLGAEGYPFTADHIKTLVEKKRAEKEAAQTLEKLLVAPNRDWVLGKEDKHVPVSELHNCDVVGLYFSASWCGPCHHFTPVLAKVYNELKAQNKKFEVVFLSSDQDEASCKSYYDEMPWLMLPFGDPLIRVAAQWFGVRGIPTLILLNNEGKTISASGRGIISQYGACGFPWGTAQLEELEREEKEKMAALPKWVKPESHAHPLELRASVYGGSWGCDMCGEGGSGWVYHCDLCHYDCHIKCVEGAPACDAPSK